MRVARGHAWGYDEQDGGAGSVGVVQELGEAAIREWLIGGITGEAGGGVQSQRGNV